MKIDWSKIDWPDVGIHATINAVVTGLGAVGLFAGIGLLWWPAAMIGTAVFYVREVFQRNPPQPRFWLWGPGAQAEFYAPAGTALITAMILTAIL